MALGISYQEGRVAVNVGGPSHELDPKLNKKEEKRTKNTAAFMPTCCLTTDTM